MALARVELVAACRRRLAPDVRASTPLPPLPPPLPCRVAEASCTTLREMNPFVSVTAVHEAQDWAGAGAGTGRGALWRGADLVLLLDRGIGQVDEAAAACHAAGVGVYAGGTSGAVGWLFADLGQHEFAVERRSVDAAGEASSVLTHTTRSYCPWREAMAADLRARPAKRLHSVYLMLRGACGVCGLGTGDGQGPGAGLGDGDEGGGGERKRLGRGRWRWEGEVGTRVGLGSSRFGMSEVLQASRLRARELFAGAPACRAGLERVASADPRDVVDGLGEEVGRPVADAVLFGLEGMARGAPGMPAVSAVLGGVLANDVVKAVARKGETLDNFFLYSIADGAGVVDRYQGEPS